MPTPNSLQATPDLSPTSLSQAHIPPMALSELSTSAPVHSYTVTSPTAMSEAISMGQKRSIVRKVSHKLRRRTSASQTSRDQSAGPTMMRRRSDSNRNVIDSGVELDGYEQDDYYSASEDAVEESHDLTAYFGSSPTGAGLGISTGRSSISSDPSVQQVRPDALEKGTQLVKVTKRKRKDMLFRIEYAGAKLCWHPSNSSKCIYIDDISEIVFGQAADHYFEEYQVPKEEQSRWFSITYSDPDGTKGRNQRTIHLIAPDRDLFEKWVNQLDEVSRMRIELINGLVRGGEKSLRQIWHMEMSRKFGNAAAFAVEEQKLEFADIRQLCRKLNINCSEQTLLSRFSKVDEGKQGSLNYPQFAKFIRKVLDRKEVNLIYNSIKSNPDEPLDKDALFQFLQDEQKINVNADPTRWTRIFEKYAKMSRKGSASPTAVVPAKQTISQRAFQHLLADPEVFPVLQECPSQPKLDRPLNEYFISSSHNTYLPARQYFSTASVEAYRSALRGGCRCIEIDCWDGGLGKPEVRHGPYTTPVAFSDCISVVNQYAFATCKYPVIISLEVHCSAEQQQTMVDIMKRTFGDKLLTKELVEDAEVLPSPEELKERILLKVKSAEVPEDPTPISENPPLQRRGRGFSSPFVRPVIMASEPQTIALSSPPSISSPERTGSFGLGTKGSAISTPLSINSSSEDSDAQALASPTRKKHKTSKIIPTLGELAVYTKGVSFRNKNFESPELQSYNHVVSLAEGTFLALTGPSKPSESANLVDKHNVNHLMRVYPAGKRVTSSNFDPLTNWRYGVQMAALNWQTYDLPIQMNRAMFAGGSDITGYSLKPDDLRPLKDEDDEEAEDLPRRKGKKLVQFEIEVVSAKQLPRQLSRDGKEVPTNAFVDLEVYCAEDKARGVISGIGGDDKSSGDGLTGLGAPLRKRTVTIYDNGHDPVFKQKFSFSVETRHPGLIFVRWVVRNSVDSTRDSTSTAPVGTYTARLSSLQQGYRYLPLFDRNGEQYLHSSLLCRVKVDEHIQLDEPNSSVQSLTSQPSITPSSPPTDAAPKRGFFTRVLHRTPSDRKKRDRENSLIKDGNSIVSISRTTSIDK
ncbi:PLC-like phosphodiesterase [Rhizodiscina lignyota]|uniref:Phosphoinositide phospholipase C n=1 Tax=Rhizodiscina lignyota TaxID=1504668 RepID=A0A9P4IN47_9PEZI|nr:PLC-like phosphodiesterase [Rhizodiscina lignyota]